MNAAEASRATPVALPWGVAWRLALGQIVAGGILYYAFTVAREPVLGKAHCFGPLMRGRSQPWPDRPLA